MNGIVGTAFMAGSVFAVTLRIVGYIKYLIGTKKDIELWMVK